MLKLRTPIVIGSRSYDCLVLGVGKWDLTARRIDILLRPAQEQADHLHVGSQREKGSGVLPLPPPVVGSLKLEDTPDGDPTFATLLGQLQQTLDALEAFAASHDLLAAVDYDLGEDHFNLACDYQPSTKPPRTKRLPKTPEG